MAQENLNYGTGDNDGTGDGLRDAFVKVENNFNELYSGIIQTVAVPANATATGVLNQIAIDTSYIYVCVATNVWVRASLTTW